MIRRLLSILFLFMWFGTIHAQINIERVMMMGRNALYYEDYVLSIQRFNMVIGLKPYLAEPYFYRGLAKFYLEDYNGAETDVSSAIQKNPYNEQYFVLRGLCRINLGHFDTAERDYKKAVEINPINPDDWHNLVLCQLQQDGFDRADSCLDTMLKHWPKESQNYTLRAQVLMGKKDTAKAEKWVDKALEVNAFDGGALGIKSMFLLRSNHYAEGEKMLDRAIVQRPREADLYINRALARYNQENLRGAMSDYDAALELNPESYVGHFNRALLRAQVGDDNHAIEDFNFVIKKEPDNYIAIYNRALLYNNTGELRKAMQDLSSIIAVYPQFWDGYMMRASIRRKIGDVYGAERDEFKVLKARVEGVSKKKSKKKTRKQSDKNLDDYNMLVENENNGKVEDYASDYRGHVQNHTAELQPQSPFVLTYFPKQATVSHYLPYMATVDRLNSIHVLSRTLYVNNAESGVGENTLKQLFDDISMQDSLSIGTEDRLLRCALDYYHVRDFESGISNLDSLLSIHPNHQLALFLRAQLRTASVLASHPELTTPANQPLSPSTEVRLAANMAIDDLRSLLAQDGKLAYAHYNMGGLYLLLHDYDLAITCYDKAIAVDALLPDAFFNRGIAYILSGKREKGLADLSQAGEFGLYSAYNLIKRYSHAAGSPTGK